MAVRDLYEKACEAANKGNYDYAIELLREVLRHEPEYPDARVLLRGAERRRLKELGSTLYNLGHLLLGLWPLLKAQIHVGSPRKRMECYEDFLEHRPDSSIGSYLAGRAAHGAGLTNAAAAILKDLLSRKPNYKKALRLLGNSLEEAGQTKEALTYLRPLAALSTGDRELQHRVRNMEAQAHMQETRMEEAGSFRDMIRDQDFAMEAEKRFEQVDKGSTRLLEGVKSELEQDPTNVTKIVRLADLYEDYRQPDKALRLLTEAHRKQADNYELRARLGDLQLRICDRILNRTTQRFQKEPENEQLRRKQQSLRGKRLQVAMREYRWRVRQHPTDLNVRFKLGQVLLETGDFDEAIASFQQAARDPRLELGAVTMLGDCFMKKEQYDLAAERFRRAIEQHERFDELGMELNYKLARALEHMGDQEEALQIYKRIYTVDIGFRDVSHKVEMLAT